MSQNEKLNDQLLFIYEFVLRVMFRNSNSRQSFSFVDMIRITFLAGTIYEIRCQTFADKYKYKQMYFRH